MWGGVGNHSFLGTLEMSWRVYTKGLGAEPSGKMACQLPLLTFGNTGGFGSDGPNEGTSSRAVTATYQKEFLNKY